MVKRPEGWVSPLKGTTLTDEHRARVSEGVQRSWDEGLHDREALSLSSKLAMHNRWHVKHGKVNLDCPHCAEASDIERAQWVENAVSYSDSEETRVKKSAALKKRAAEMSDAQMERKRALSRLSAHNRWHVKRGLVNPDCGLCCGQVDGIT